MAQQITGGPGGRERGPVVVVGKRVVHDAPGAPREVELARSLYPHGANEGLRAAIDRAARMTAMTLGATIGDGRVRVENIEYQPASSINQPIQADRVDSSGNSGQLGPSTDF